MPNICSQTRISKVLLIKIICWEPWVSQVQNTCSLQFFSVHSLGFHSFVRLLSEWIATHMAVNHPCLQILRIDREGMIDVIITANCKSGALTTWPPCLLTFI